MNICKYAIEFVDFHKYNNNEFQTQRFERMYKSMFTKIAGACKAVLLRDCGCLKMYSMQYKYVRIALYQMTLIYFYNFFLLHHFILDFLVFFEIVKLKYLRFLQNVYINLHFFFLVWKIHIHSLNYNINDSINYIISWKML